MQTNSANPILHFVSYGTSGTHYIEDSLHLATMANSTGWFQPSTVYVEEDIPSWAKKKYEQIHRLQCGGGYWIWRVPFIQKKINEIKDREFVVRLDSYLKVSDDKSDGSILMEWAELLIYCFRNLTLRKYGQQSSFLRHLMSLLMAHNGGRHKGRLETYSCSASATIFKITLHQFSLF
jgi:hypothetical protein